MKDAKKILSLLSKSLDESIQAATEATVGTCRATGFARLPDDVLICIFEMYIDMIVFSDYELFPSVKISPQILSSVCRRFREIVLRRSNLWRNISLTFPKHILLAYKERCRHPILHIEPAVSTFSTYEEMLDVIQPHHQWRELRLHVTNEDHLHRYFERLKPSIHGPFQALESLSISNEFELTFDEIDTEHPFAIHLDERHSTFLSSWQMPKLTHLELRNVLPSPLQCANVASLSLELAFAEQELCMKKFQRLMQSMPKMQSLSITFKMEDLEFDEPPLCDDTPTLPSLTCLEVRIGKPIKRNTLLRFMALVNTRKLTRLTLSFRGGGDSPSSETDFAKCITAIFPWLTFHRPLRPPFEFVENFALDTWRYLGTEHFFERIFNSMPNVQRVSLVLPHSSNIRILDRSLDNEAFKRLRILQVMVPRMPSYKLPFDEGGFDALFNDKRCRDFKKMEVRVGPLHSTEKGKARLRSLLGEKLHWIESSE